MKLFDHPCKHTCSGWQQGHEEGLRAGKLWAIEVLRSQNAVAAHAIYNLDSGGMGSRPYQFADYLESKIDEVMK